jgi:outer membrane protein TolC
VRLKALGTATFAMVAASCAHSPPSIDGVAPTPAASSATWTPPPSVTVAAARDTAGLALSKTPTRQLTLPEVIDVALRNNPATKVSWTQARAAADVYGSSQGRLLPTVLAGVTANQQLTAPTPGRASVERYQYGPSVSLSYTVLDFGGRTGSIDVARQTAVAANLTHNSTVENTILQVESAAFTYLGARAERDAAKAALDEATAALDVANERHRVGLATIADVLQARTARSQSELALEGLEGSVLVTRGSLAVAMGLPANTPVDIPEVGAADSVHFVTESVDTLIALAVRNRPELATARAQAAAAQSQIRVVKAASLPALALTATGATNGSSAPGFSGPVYQLGFGIQVPVFTGFSTQFDIRAAQEQYQSALARAETTKQQVIQQVFTAYYTLRTSTERVRTTRDLLASATQSEVVARERYKEGVGSIVDLLIAQSALASARAESVNARWAWRSSLAQLAHDVGILNARGDTTFAPLTPAPDVRPQR